MGVCDDVTFAWVRLLARGKRQMGREVSPAAWLRLERFAWIAGWRSLDGARPGWRTNGYAASIAAKVPRTVRMEED